MNAKIAKINSTRKFVGLQYDYIHRSCSIVSLQFHIKLAFFHYKIHNKKECVFHLLLHLYCTRGILYFVFLSHCNAQVQHLSVEFPTLILLSLISGLFLGTKIHSFQFHTRFLSVCKELI